MDSLINEVMSSILEKPVLDADDAVTVDGGVEISAPLLTPIKDDDWSISSSHLSPNTPRMLTACFV